MSSPTAPASSLPVERIPRTVILLNAGLTAAAVVAVVAGAGLRHRSGTPAWVILPLVVALAIAGSLRLAYRYGSELEDLDVFEAMLAPALLLFGVTGVVTIVVMAKVASETISRRRFIKAWFNVAQWAVAAAAGAITIGLLDGDGGVDALMLVALLTAMVVVAVVNHAALVAVMSLVTRSSPRRVLHDLRPAIAYGWLLRGALNVAFGLLVGTAAVGTPLVTPLFVVPLGALHLASKHLAQERTVRRLRHSVQDANAVLSHPVDPRDGLEPFLALVVDAFTANAARLVLFDVDGSDVHHVGAPPALAYAHWRAGPVSEAVTSLTTASVLSPKDDGAVALLEPGWRKCLTAPVRIDARTRGVLCVLDPQGFAHDGDGDLAALEAMAAGMASSLARADMVDEVFAAHRRSELLLTREGQVLESIAGDDPLPTSLAEVVGFVEAAVPTGRCVIAVSLEANIGIEDGTVMSSVFPPPTSTSHVLVGDGPPPPVSVLASLRAASEGGHDMVVVRDVHLDARWDQLSHRWTGFRSSWVVPVELVEPLGLIGAVCVAHPEARAAVDTERAVLGVARRLARLAVERALSRAQLLHQARYDRLTGLGNRTAFLEEMDRAQARSHRSGRAFGVLFIDLDRFKYVNDSMGHDAGDALLVAVACRLQALVRSNSLARYGGDEFTVLCEDLGDANDALVVATRVAKALGVPYILKDVEVMVTGSIGVALAGRDITPAELIDRADAAMYRAKARGRNRVEIFDEHTREESRRRLFEQTELRQGLDAGEFVVHYQPLLSLTDLAVTGVEALVRWRQTDGSLVGPDDFIGLAEETGLIIPLGSFVLNEACRQAQQWRRDDRNASLGMSVNVSARQISQGDLVATVTRALRNSELPPDALTLEITETALMEVTESSGALRELRDRGVVIAIDDFGIGYSSLDYLRRLPIDVIKLDRVFLQELGTNRTTWAIVSSVVKLARTLGLSVVAEGIETAEQLSLLRDLGCAVGQGFYLGEPVDHHALDLARPGGNQNR